MLKKSKTGKTTAKKAKVVVPRGNKVVASASAPSLSLETRRTRVPDEVYMWIFASLDLASLLNCNLVCHSWNR